MGGCGAEQGMGTIETSELREQLRGEQFSPAGVGLDNSVEKGWEDKSG